MAGNFGIKLAAIFLTFVAFSSARNFPDFVDALTDLQLLNNNPLEGAWLEASYDLQWLQTIVKNSTLQQYPASTMSGQCWHDLSVWADSLKRLEPWAMQSKCKLVDGLDVGSPAF